MKVELSDLLNVLYYLLDKEAYKALTSFFIDFGEHKPSEIKDNENELISTYLSFFGDRTAKETVGIIFKNIFALKKGNYSPFERNILNTHWLFAE